MEPPSEEIKNASLDLLRKPDLLSILIDDFRAGGLVGELSNSLLTWLNTISSLLDDPSNLRSSGRSALGKTRVAVEVVARFPPELVVLRAGMTKKSAYYLPDAVEVDWITKRIDFTGKVLVLLEESQSQEFLDEIKPLLSHDTKRLVYSFVEDQVTKSVVLEGFPAYIGITTASVVSEEQATRALLTSPDKGEEKYGAVILDDADRHAFPWLYPVPDLRIWHEAVRQLHRLKVLNPWLPFLARKFPKKYARAMRDWKKLRVYIEAVVVFHQYQREVVEIHGNQYVIATPFDNQVALAAVQSAMLQTLMGLEKDVKEFFESMKECDGHGAAYWTTKEMLTHYRQTMGEYIGRSTLKRRFIDKLVELGCLDVDDSKKTHKYFVVENSLADSSNLNDSYKAVFSEENKAKILEKIVSTMGGEREGNPRQNSINLQQIAAKIEKSYGLTLDSVETLKKQLSATKKELYPEKSLLFDSVQSARSSGQENLEPFQCPECAKLGQKVVFQSEEHLRIHLGRIHHPMRICSLCNDPLPPDGANTTVIDGKTVHERCYRKLKESVRQA